MGQGGVEASPGGQIGSQSGTKIKLLKKSKPCVLSYLSRRPLRRRDDDDERRRCVPTLPMVPLYPPTAPPTATLIG